MRYKFQSEKCKLLLNLSAQRSELMFHHLELPSPFPSKENNRKRFCSNGLIVERKGRVKPEIFQPTTFTKEPHFNGFFPWSLEKACPNCCSTANNWQTRPLHTMSCNLMHDRPPNVVQNLDQSIANCTKTTSGTYLGMPHLSSDKRTIKHQQIFCCFKIYEKVWNDWPNLCLCLSVQNWSNCKSKKSHEVEK